MTKAGTGRRMVIIVHEWMREVGKKNTYEIADFLLENSSSYHMTTSNLAQTIHKSPLFRKVGKTRSKNASGTGRTIGVWETIDWDEAVEDYAVKLANGTTLMRYDSLPKKFLYAAEAKSEEIKEAFAKWD